MTFFDDLVSDPIVYRLGWALVHSVWQFAAISTLLLVALWLLRHRSPGVRYFTSCVALAAMMVAVLVTFSLVKGAPGSPELANSSATLMIATTEGEWGQAAATYKPSSQLIAKEAAAVAKSSVLAANRTSDDPARNFPQVRIANVSLLLGPKLPWIVCIWMCGVLTMWLRHLGGWFHLKRLCRYDVQPVSAKIQNIVTDVMRRMSITRAIALLESSRIDVPATMGSLRPVILLPGCMFTGLSPPQLEAILAHELAHIRRHDYLLNLLQVVIETMLFYHPAVWWVNRRIRMERENCCDDIALDVCGDPMTYARALTRLEEIRGASTSTGLAIAASGSDAGALMRRIRRVLGVSRANNSLSWPCLGGCVATLLLSIALATTILVAADAQDIAERVKPQTRHAEKPADENTAERIRIFERKSEPIIKQQLEKMGARVMMTADKIAEVHWDANRIRAREVLTEVDMRLLRGLSSLRTLKLDSSPVTDADLMHLSDLRGLTALSLYKTDITDVGLGHLRSLKNLKSLALQGTGVGDASMKFVKEFDNLSYLYLSGATITDEGMAQISNLRKLETLYLNNTRITDKAMVYVKGMTRLETLYLHNTVIGDKGIKHLLMLQNLKTIHIANTQVSDKGIEYLKSAIPNLKITTRFGRPKKAR